MLAKQISTRLCNAGICRETCVIIMIVFQTYLNFTVCTKESNWQSVSINLSHGLVNMRKQAIHWIDDDPVHCRINEM